MSSSKQNPPNPRISLARTLVLAAVFNLLALCAAGFHKNYILGAFLNLLDMICLATLGALIWTLPDNTVPTSRKLRIFLGMSVAALTLGIGKVAYVIVARPEVIGWLFWTASIATVALPIWALTVLRHIATQRSLQSAG